jgi:hypothetical protein
MQRISEVLQLPIIVERGRPLALKSQPFQEVDFLLRSVAPEERILEEGLQPRLLAARVFAIPFKKRKFLQVLGD